MTSFNVLFQPWGESLNFILQVLAAEFCLKLLHFHSSKLTDNSQNLGSTTVYSGFRAKKLSCPLYMVSILVEIFIKLFTYNFSKALRLECEEPRL